MSLLTLDFASHGYSARIRAETPEVLEHVRAAIPFGARIAVVEEPQATFAIEARSADLHVLRVDGAEIAGPAPLQGILNAFESHAIMRLAERSPDYVFVHSGVIAWGGQAVLFPGYSFYGKTTLVADCVRAGATYYSDEYALLDVDGRVHPYPRPLQIRKDGESH